MAERFGGRAVRFVCRRTRTRCRSSPRPALRRIRVSTVGGRSAATWAAYVLYRIYPLRHVDPEVNKLARVSRHRRSAVGCADQKNGAKRRRWPRQWSWWRPRDQRRNVLNVGPSQSRPAGADRRQAELRRMERPNSSRISRRRWRDYPGLINKFLHQPIAGDQGYPCLGDGNAAAVEAIREAFGSTAAGDTMMNRGYLYCARQESLMPHRFPARHVVASESTLPKHDLVLRA